MNAVLLGVIINGVLLGGIYALFAVGLTVTFSAMRVFNVAYGALMTFAITIAATHFTDAPFLIVVAAGIVTGGVTGALIELIAVMPLRSRGIPEHQFGETTFLTTLGALMIVDSLSFRETDGQFQSFPTSDTLTRGVNIGTIYLQSGYLIGASVAVVLIVAIWLAVAKTQGGRSLRAIAADPGMAALVGINVRGYSMTSAALTGITGGLAGVLLASTFISFDYTFGDGFLLRGFAIVILAGMGSIGGVLLGGVILGLTENLLGYYGGISWTAAAGPLVIALILLLRPSGLFGTRRVDRA